MLGVPDGGKAFPENGVKHEESSRRIPGDPASPWDRLSYLITVGNSEQYMQRAPDLRERRFIDQINRALCPLNVVNFYNLGCSHGLVPATYPSRLPYKLSMVGYAPTMGRNGDGESGFVPGRGSLRNGYHIQEGSRAQITHSGREGSDKKISLRDS
ncbi:hypothetical protein JTE90_020478 [Oedothorax gibbosus]|uniref:Uncharacterized protein n=1 Tax=Oedothorax gibbosus TaxID=931172 RepID=A0AAV6TGT7_9ARAC|nr:hypothetical protein JTE90_020478 [Oedothorax gibbosus]